jgi:predicted regulator of Ras-like GTPase activity (Roadblock/LC7/MglB family)
MSRNDDEHNAIHAGVSEFGDRMAELLSDVRAASGAVLSDDQGDPIDTARRIHRSEEIDVEIAGAQIGQCLARLSGNSQVFGLGTPTVIAESSYGMLIAKPLQHAYLLTLLLDRRTSLTQALQSFEAAADDLDALMD